MKRKNWRSALRVDFSENNALKATLLAELMQRPDAPSDMKEDEPMKKTIKYSTRVLICALVAVILLSGVALGAMKSFSLGPFATYTQMDNVALHQEIDEYVNSNRSVWEGKLFDKDGNPIEDLAAYYKAYIDEGQPYELYDANGELCGLTEIDGKVVLAGAKDRLDEYETSEMNFKTLDEVKPHLHPQLDPALPTVLPDGFELDHFSIFTDEDGKPYMETLYLTITYAQGDKMFDVLLQLMNEESAFETTGLTDLETLNINGHDAIRDGDLLSMLIGDVLYEFFPMDSGVTVDEMIKMAGSIQE